MKDGKNDGLAAGAAPLPGGQATPPATCVAFSMEKHLALVAAHLAAWQRDLDGSRATARKGHRFPSRPWLPVIRHPKGSGVTTTSSYNETIRNRAYATREEAVALAERELAARRDRHAERIAALSKTEGR